MPPWSERLKYRSFIRETGAPRRERMSFDGGGGRQRFDSGSLCQSIPMPEHGWFPPNQVMRASRPQISRSDHKWRELWCEDENAMPTTTNVAVDRELNANGRWKSPTCLDRNLLLDGKSRNGPPDVRGATHREDLFRTLLKICARCGITPDSARWFRSRKGDEGWQGSVQGVSAVLRHPRGKTL